MNTNSLAHTSWQQILVPFDAKQKNCIDREIKLKFMKLFPIISFIYK